jgi:ribulose-5-phosphate 4-epimerase/fuculose-1-phosphate aldolase
VSSRSGTLAKILQNEYFPNCREGRSIMNRRSAIRIFCIVSFCLLVVISARPSYGADEASIKQLKETLITANRILDMEGLVRPMGHISVRLPGTETFLITRSIAPGMSTVDDVVVCNMDGKVVEGKYSRTFGEVMGHAAVYRKRKDIQSVAHTHSPYAIALTMTENTLLPASVTALKAGFDPIQLYKKVAMLELREVAEAVADLIGANKVVLLKGHGALVVGKSIEETTINSIDLEVAAKLQVIAMQTGKLMPFGDEEREPLVKFLKMMETRGGTDSPHGRAWEYYKSLLRK